MPRIERLVASFVAARATFRRIRPSFRDTHAKRGPARRPDSGAHLFGRAGSAARRHVSIVTIAPILVVVMALVLTMVVIAFAIVRVCVLGALVMMHVFVVVPLVLHEIDGPAAGAVLTTMLAPVLLMPRRHMQIDRRHLVVFGCALNDNRLGVHDRRPWHVSDFDLPVKAWLSDADRDRDIAGDGRRATQREHKSSDDMSHDGYSQMTGAGY